jgi:uncharacterized membrane protein
MTTINPYAAPKAAVADETLVLSDDFVPGGLGQPASHGWDWIAAAWDLFKRQPGLWIGIWLLLMLMTFGVALIPFLGNFITMLVWPVLIAGIVIGCRALDEGRELELGHLFAGFQQRTGTLFAVGGLYLAGVLALSLVVFLVVGAGVFAVMSGGEADPAMMAAMGGIGVLLGVLIVMALMLPLVMAMWFAPALVVFHDMGALDSMKMSFAGCLKNILPFLLFSAIFVALAIVATLPILLGWLVLGPVVSITVYTAYRDIFFKPR